MRYFLSILCLSGGLFAIDGAMTLAPDMTYPATSREWLAAYMMGLGSVVYLVGTVALINGLSARSRGR